MNQDEEGQEPLQIHGESDGILFNGSPLGQKRRHGGLLGLSNSIVSYCDQIMPINSANTDLSGSLRLSHNYFRYCDQILPIHSANTEPATEEI